METRTVFLNWLSTKLFLINVGFYATIGLIMFLPGVMTNNFAIPAMVASFIAFFIVSFLRTAYESLVVYEAPFKSLSLHKMLILTLVMSVAMSLVSYFLKPMIGFFSIPVAIVISMLVVGRLKTFLWGTHERPGFFAELPAKLQILSRGRYGFYGLLVGITYYVCHTYGMNFFVYAFAAAFFVGMLFEETYMLIKIYNQKLTAKSFVGMIAWSIACALLSTAIVMIMIKYFGYAGQAATITSVILVKLLQPVGSRKFILGV